MTFMSSPKRTTPTLAVAAAVTASATGRHVSEPSQMPDPEVLAKPRRRIFTAEYKASILKRADACAKGELGALLRSEGLYSSYLTEWRQQREQGAAAALKAKKRGRKPNANKNHHAELDQLRRRVARLEDDLRKAHVVIVTVRTATAGP
jgi:transposase-like protein